MYTRIVASLSVINLSLCLGSCGVPENVGVHVSVPATVAVEEQFVFKAIIQNDGNQAVTLNSVDIGDSFLEGVQVLSSEPTFSDTMHIPIDNTLSFAFGRSIAPGTEFDVLFQAVAKKSGRFSGDFDICINSEVSCFFEKIYIEIVP